MTPTPAEASTVNDTVAFSKVAARTYETVIRRVARPPSRLASSSQLTAKRESRLRFALPYPAQPETRYPSLNERSDTFVQSVVNHLQKISKQGKAAING
jgi:hypothetical protein